MLEHTVGTRLTKSSRRKSMKRRFYFAEVANSQLNYKGEGLYMSKRVVWFKFFCSATRAYQRSSYPNPRILASWLLYWLPRVAIDLKRLDVKKNRFTRTWGDEESDLQSCTCAYSAEFYCLWSLLNTACLLCVFLATLGLVTYKLSIQSEVSRALAESQKLFEHSLALRLPNYCHVFRLQGGNCTSSMNVLTSTGSTSSSSSGRNVMTLLNLACAASSHPRRHRLIHHRALRIGRPHSVSCGIQ